MNQYVIKLLCPQKSYGKCRRIIKKLKIMLVAEDINDDIHIINNTDKIRKYPTWITPTLVINDKVVARGYRPEAEKLREFL